MRQKTKNKTITHYIYWVSAHSFAKYRQQCKNCNTNCYPVCMWKNNKPDNNKCNRIATSPHMCNLCEACKLGKCVQQKQSSFMCDCGVV